MSAASAYLLGRRKQALESSQGATDALFAADRIDDASLQNVTFSHCTFANVSFKDCRLNNVTFINCAFISCYFRRARVENCKFSGTKFIGCDLTKIDIRASDFRYYNSFTDCYIPFRDIEQSLPNEGNLRWHLCSNLAAEARKLGALPDEGAYRQSAASALEKHLISAALGSDSYFREKYSGTARLTAFAEYLASRVRGLLWGYKRSSLVVLRNWATLTLGIFPILFLLFKDGLQRSGRPVTTGEAWLASLGNILPGSGLSDVKFVSGTCLTLAFIEVLLGLLFAGIAAALIFRAVFDRWR